MAANLHLIKLIDSTWSLKLMSTMLSADDGGVDDNTKTTFICNDQSTIEVDTLYLKLFTSFEKTIAPKWRLNGIGYILPFDVQADILVPVLDFLKTGSLVCEQGSLQRIFDLANRLD